eukprot:678013-Pelagomonas_calceolata.AAC.1
MCPKDLVTVARAEISVIDTVKFKTQADRAQPPSCYGTLVKRKEGDSKEEVPGLNSCGRGGDKDALYWREPVGGSFLNAGGRTASAGLSFGGLVRRLHAVSPGNAL